MRAKALVSSVVAVLGDVRTDIGLGGRPSFVMARGAVDVPRP
jgi:hypothetical protein